MDQSVAFLFLSCTYASMFYDHLDCSEVILLKVIFLVYHLKSMTFETVPKVQERSKNEFRRLRTSLRTRQRDLMDWKTIFFAENTNLMIALAVILQASVEMEMYEMVADMHSLFSFLSN